MRRGEIWWVNFEPIRGSEASKVRPAVIVSNDGANSAARRRQQGVLTVVPLTTSTTHVLPFQTFVAADSSVLDRDSKAQAEQVRAVDVTRFVEHVGTLTIPEQQDLDRALRLHLGL